MKLDLAFQKMCFDETPSEKDFEKWIRLTVTTIMHKENEEVEVNIRVVGEDEMSFLNSTFRKKNGTTNVLSFPTDLPKEIEPKLLGDIAICAPVVRKEAALFDRPEHYHWAHLTVHGALHLLGFDHKNPVERTEMELLEKLILAKLDIDCPYTITID